MRNNIIFLTSLIFSLVRKVFSLFNIKKTKYLITKEYTALNKQAKTLITKSRNLLNTNIEVGLYHFYKGNLSDAKLRFWLISIFYSKLPIIWYNIGRCYFASGNTTKASKYFTKALKLNNNYEEAHYYLNKMANPSIVKKVPQNLINQYFDYTGEYFVEHWLIAKQYRGHELVCVALTKVFDQESLSHLNILDVGCGTGICGHYLRVQKIGRHITGVDISNRMLNIARGCFIKGKAVYNELIHVELSDFLKQNKGKLYDVIIFAEVLHYIYNFQAELELAKESINKHGAIICLIRRQEGNKVQFINKGDYFCHSEDYVKDLALKLNMQLSYISYCKIYGSQVEGILFILQHYKS